MSGGNTPLRVGHSIDYHNITPCPKTKQKLGGVDFELDFKIEAHSDGDIILHTVSEAILGALGMGDLGVWFSDKKEEYKNMDSMEILKFCVQKCEEQEYKILNMDVSVVTDQLFMGDKKNEIEKILAPILKANVNIKATRFEATDFHKIKCYAVCLLINKYIVF